jgi:hypothetical protein
VSSETLQSQPPIPVVEIEGLLVREYAFGRKYLASRRAQLGLRPEEQILQSLEQLTPKVFTILLQARARVPEARQRSHTAHAEHAA